VVESRRSRHHIVRGRAPARPRVGERAGTTSARDSGNGARSAHKAQHLLRLDHVRVLAVPPDRHWSELSTDRSPRVLPAFDAHVVTARVVPDLPALDRGDPGAASVVEPRAGGESEHLAARSLCSAVDACGRSIAESVQVRKSPADPRFTVKSDDRRARAVRGSARRFGGSAQLDTIAPGRARGVRSAQRPMGTAGRARPAGATRGEAERHEGECRELETGEHGKGAAGSILHRAA